MTVASARQAGSEGDLFKQCLLVDLLSALCPEEGEFSYLETHTTDICREAHPLARNLSPWLHDPDGEDLPLPNFLRYQDPWLASGLYMSSAGLALRALWDKTQGRIAFRWLFEQSLILDPVRWHAHLDAWARSVGLAWSSSPHSLLLLRTPNLRALQGLASSLGPLSSPGLAWLDPPQIDDLSDLLSLISNLLQRHFYVLLHLPLLPQYGSSSPDLQTLDTLQESLRPLGSPGLSYRLSRITPRGPRLLREIWLLAPEPSLLPSLQAASQSSLLGLFGSLLPRVFPSLPPLHVEIQPLQPLLPTPSVALPLFPHTLAPGLIIDRATETDTDALLRLWEALMDEHARLDEHFQRHPFARVYLRSQILQQISSPDHLLLVLRDKGSTVGYLSAQVLCSTLFQETRFGQIIDLYLQPSWRRRSLGRLLVEDALLWFRSFAIRQIDLNVAFLNPSAEGFWRALGFQPYLSVMSKDLSD